MRKMNICILVIALMLMPNMAKAQDFAKYFVDQTLRIDYIFAGNTQQQMIAVDELNDGMAKSNV